MRLILKIFAVYLAVLDLPIYTLLVLMSIIAPRTLPLAVAAGCFFWVVRWLAFGRLTERTGIDMGVVLLVLMLPVSMWATADPEITFPQVYRLLTGIFLYYSIVNWPRTDTRLRIIVFGVVLASLFLALFAAVSVEWYYEKLLFIPVSVYERFVLLVQDTVHRNVMAGSLVILLPITLGILLFAWKEIHLWQRILLGLAALVVLGMLVLTQSRGAPLAFAGISLLLIALRWRWGWLAILVSGVGVILLNIYIGIERSLEFISSGVSLGGLEGRLEVWSRALYMIQDFAFTGIGIGSFGPLADILYPFFLSAPGSVPHAHNLILQVAVDLGIPGLIAWLSIIVVIISITWQIYCAGRIHGSGWMAGLGAGLLISQVALLTHGLFDAVTWGMVRTAPLVWGIWGIAAAVANLYLSDRRPG